MKEFSTKSKLLYVVIFGFVAGMYLTSCKKTVYPILVNGQLNIGSYIEKNPRFSLFDQILQKTGYYSFLQAYGSYTIFAPNDDAVKLYMKSKGKSSVDEFNVDSLRELVRYHVVQNDTISTVFFIDGKLRSPTMLNQYLTTGGININGVSSYIVNGQALILQTNVACGNGILHVIDHVLQPASKTIAQILVGNPKYSIFTQALKATGYYDTINVAATQANNYKYFTVFAQTDSVYQSVGIPNYAALVTKYSALGSNPLNNPNDGLHNYIAYHILPENSYLTDILSKASHQSISPGLDVISNVLQNQTIQLNYDLINGVQYPGASVDRANSNIPATNGVLHAVLGDIFIKVFPPTRVDWDLADQPEFRKQTSIFRVPGKSSIGLTSPLTDITFDDFRGTVTYDCQATGNGSYYWWNDILSFHNFRNTVGSGSIISATLTTPVIIKGKYKVWISYQHSSESTGIQFFFDGNALQNVVPNITNTYITLTASVTDSGPVLESKGWKRYTEAPVTSTGNAFYNTVALFYCGVVNVPTTDRHQFKLLAIGSPNANATGFDMVQFIPVDQDQETPRYFRRDGSVN
jgi:uncharacterized surface protein with fasciclin (FAS1) repeats